MNSKFLIGLISVIASVIGVFAFVTGFQSLSSIFATAPTEEDKRSILLKTDKGLELKTPKIERAENKAKRYPFLLKPPEEFIQEANSMATVLPTKGSPVHPREIAASALTQRMKEYLDTKKGRAAAMAAFYETYHLPEEYRGVPLQNLIELDSCTLAVGTCFLSVIDNY